MTQPNITPDEFARLNACSSADDWEAATSAIKAARGGAYPDDWYSRMLATGLADKIVGRFGKAGFAVTSFETTEELRDALNGKPTPNARTSIVDLPPHAVDAEGVVQVEPILARLRTIQHARADLRPQIAQVCGALAEHMDDAEDNAEGLVKDDLLMAWATFAYDMQTGVNGFTHERMPDPFRGMPPLVKHLAMMAARDVYVECCPEQLQKELAETFRQIDAEVIEAARARAKTQAG